LASKGKGKYVWDPDKQTWVRPGQVKAEPAAETEAPTVEAPKEAEPAEAPPEPVKRAEPAEDAAAVRAWREEEAPEATEEEEELVGLPYVGAGARLIAIVIDAIIYGFVTWAITRFIPEDNNVLLLIVSIATLVVYFAGFWIWRGQTPGKMVVRARVVLVDGSKMDPIRSVLRAVIYIVYYVPMSLLGNYALGEGWSYLFVVLAMIVVLILLARRADKRALHDLLLGTMVISSQTAVEVVDEEEPAQT